MTLIVEFVLGSPILREASTEIERRKIEDITQPATGPAKVIFWAFGDAFDAFESGLDADETVDTYSMIEATGDRRLYRVTLSDRGMESLTYPLAAEHDITFLDVTGFEETEIRARVPSREALVAYRSVCQEKEIPFRLQRIYQEEPVEADRYGVTDRQRAALRAALEAGYFDVPRDATLSTVAATLDISDQALSARLRRGQANLLRNTIATDHDPT
ncbi:helix-turn-helix domain-containing protein [Halosolutus amylolyticus]|uniref:Helix-turn-helix domain-containing protein n=1 Tax=Halosolutus amylolyticus TaxID=2932267 RepID=A0ABD5PT41_9EURY|nr:helix-turn-helix domain-containing protein [Halosolutus amylolyticus]